MGTAKKAPRRAAIYCRISQDSSGSGAGVARQEAACRERVEDEGWTLVSVYVDNSRSAIRGKRPEFSSMMEAAEAGEFDVIVGWQQSRLWRSPKERAEAVEALRQADVSLALVQGIDFDLRTATGRHLARITGEGDTLESELKSERVTAASWERAQAGRPSGAAPYGYLRADRTNVPDPATAPVVVEIVTRVAAGDSVTGIANDLNARGIPSPRGGTWWPATVRVLAQRRSSGGERVYQGKVIGAANWPAIVDPGLIAQATANLATASRRTNTRGTERRHLLTFGLGECGVCGGVLRSKMEPKSGRLMYQCDGRGAHVARRMDLVDELTRDVVVALLERDADDLMPTGGESAAAAQRQAEAVRGRLDDAAELFAAGGIDASQLAAITARLRPELDAAEAVTSSTADTRALRRILGDGRRGARSRWDALTVVQRRELMRLLGIAVLIHPAGGGRRFRPELIEFRRA